jgi:hypothetical protein
MFNKYKTSGIINIEDQATNEELQEFLAQGLITIPGNIKKKARGTGRYELDFVSKTFQGTIQNNNLPSGEFYETWLSKLVKPIEEKYHIPINGYANSWIIDPARICSEKEFCIRNSDGSYDLEIVLEFWPQRIYYLGLGVSSVTLIGGIGYLICDFIRKTKIAAQ